MTNKGLKALNYFTNSLQNGLSYRGGYGPVKGKDVSSPRRLELARQDRERLLAICAAIRALRSQP